jgi:hypothetical protein
VFLWATNIIMVEKTEKEFPEFRNWNKQKEVLTSAHGVFKK